MENRALPLKGTPGFSQHQQVPLCSETTLCLCSQVHSEILHTVTPTVSSLLAIPRCLNQGADSATQVLGFTDHPDQNVPTHPHSVSL